MNTLLKNLLLFLVLTISNRVFSQFQINAFAGNKESELLGIFDKDFKSNPKWNYFGSGSFSYNYDEKKLGVQLYQNLNYQIAKNLGFSLGATISNDDVSPLLGLAYSREIGNFGFSFFPGINYSFTDKEMGYGFYSFAEYTPKINENLNFYSMLIISTDLSFKEHTLSYQDLRLGLETKKKFQYGIGTSISETGKDFSTEANYGVFFGKKF